MSRSAPGAGEWAGRRYAGFMSQSADLAVVGGGIIGLAVAWRAAAAGLTVALHERDEQLGTHASRAAGGMLAPVAEADPQEPALLDLSLRSAAAWPAFANALEQASGVAPGFRPSGTLLVARDPDEAAWAERERALRERLGLPVTALLGSQARALEPGLAPGLRSAVEFADDHCADPVATVTALAEACRRAGVVIHTGSEVGDLAALTAGHVVDARGAWAGTPVRPVKGQALWLRDPSGPGLVTRVLRWGVPIPGYLIPRGDGRYFLGATAEEQGFSRTATVWGVHDLLRDVAELVPGIRELEIERIVVGPRPGTPDNLPLLGRDPADPRIVRACGHFRNGVLLAPLTAELVLDAVAGRDTPAALSPARFRAVAA